MPEIPDHADDTDWTRLILRPLALGYLRAHLLATEPELERTKHSLEVFARHAGYSLGSVYVEQVVGAPSAFWSLVAAAQAQDAGALVVPSLRHLEVVGDPAALRAHLEQTIRARVLIATEALKPTDWTGGSGGSDPVRCAGSDPRPDDDPDLRPDSDPAIGPDT